MNSRCLFLQVLLMYKGKGFCGGVIFKPTWILTASHCLENTDAKFLKVVAGTSPSTRLHVVHGVLQTILSVCVTKLLLV